jgi:Fe-S cluster biogenesis protein NfuA
LLKLTFRKKVKKVKKEQQYKFVTNNGGFIEIKQTDGEVIISFNGPSESTGVKQTVSHILVAEDMYEFTKAICEINKDIALQAYMKLVKELPKA